jgi:hypothetical protein
MKRLASRLRARLLRLTSPGSWLKERSNGRELRFKYDRDADILHIDKRSPYPEQESEELGDEVIARLNPRYG